jgi:hypothetical protein
MPSYPSRRKFLAQTTLGVLGTAIAAEAQNAPPPGAPPAFGTAPSSGPEVSAATFAAAEKLVQVQMTPADRAQAAGNWRNSMAPLYERRVGPRKVAIEETIAPWSRWDAALPGTTPGPQQAHFVRSTTAVAPVAEGRSSHRLRSPDPPLTLG